MRRRAFLAKAAAAPVAAISADVAKGADMPTGILSGARLGEVYEDCIAPVPPEANPIASAARQYLKEKIDRLEAKRSIAYGHMPYDIATKKSWSPAFKDHAVQQDRQPDLWLMDDDEMIAFAVKQGFKL